MKETLTRRGFLKMLGKVTLGTAMALDGISPGRSRHATSLATTYPPGSPPRYVSLAEREFLATHELKTGNRTKPVVLMTYDDVLTSNRLDYLLDIYREYSLKCSFFFIGIDLDRCRASLPRLVEEGHDLGCHGWIHDSAFTTLTDENIHDQFARFFGKIDEILPGYPLRYFRAPFGDRNQHVRDLAASWGLQHVLWSLESGGLDLSTIHYVVDRVANGSIVLSHAHRPYDVSEADVILRELARKGYGVETITAGMDPADRWDPTIDD